MVSRFKNLLEAKKINPPQFVNDGLIYEVLMGSECYGVAEDDSDVDIYGICIPPVNIVFPHLNGEILGFGRQTKRFGQYQEHGIKHDSGKIYDLQIYNIVKFFQLAMNNNPNIIDALFVPDNCICYMSAIGSLIRFNRNIFLHKGCYHKFKGYAYSQLNKVKNKKPIGKRKELIEKHSFDKRF